VVSGEDENARTQESEVALVNGKSGEWRKNENIGQLGCTSNS